MRIKSLMMAALSLKGSWPSTHGALGEVVDL